MSVRRGLGVSRRCVDAMASRELDVPVALRVRRYTTVYTHRFARVTVTTTDKTRFTKNWYKNGDIYM